MLDITTAEGREELARHRDALQELAVLGISGAAQAEAASRIGELLSAVLQGATLLQSLLGMMD